MYKKYTLNEDFFKTITPDSAYVLGWILSDGCINFVPGKTYQIRLELRDRDILEKIKKVMDSDIKIYNTSRRTARVGKTEKSETVSPLYLLQINSKRMIRDLLDLGVTPCKTKRVSIPDKVKGEHFRHFARGYFEGDGSIYNIRRGKYVQVISYICSTSREILAEFGEVFRDEMNIIPKINKEQALHATVPLYKLKYGSKETYALCRYLYEDATIYLDRKRDIYLNSLENKVGICVKQCKMCSKELVDVNGNTRYCGDCKKIVLRERDRVKSQKRKLQRKQQQEIVSS